MAKMARERKVQERRVLKAEKKQARAALRAAGIDPFAEQTVEEGDETEEEEDTDLRDGADLG